MFCSRLKSAQIQHKIVILNRQLHGTVSDYAKTYQRQTKHSVFRVNLSRSPPLSRSLAHPPACSSFERLSMRNCDICSLFSCSTSKILHIKFILESHRAVVHHQLGWARFGLVSARKKAFQLVFLCVGSIHGVCTIRCGMRRRCHGFQRSFIFIACIQITYKSQQLQNFQAITHKRSGTKTKHTHKHTECGSK